MDRDKAIEILKIFLKESDLWPAPDLQQAITMAVLDMAYIRDHQPQIQLAEQIQAS